MIISPNVSIITININDLLYQIKQTVRVNKLITIFLQETHIQYKYTYRLKEWRKIHHGNKNLKNAEVAVLISDKACFEQGNI